MKSKRQERGCILTVVGGSLWGFSGTCGQYLLQKKGLTSDWLVPYRLLLAGMILLAVCYIQNGPKIFGVWKKPRDAAEILIFGIVGMSMCQYTYFTAIACSNAGTATVLQYLGPVLIVAYVSFRRLRLPSAGETAAVILAVAGTFLLATHGNLHTLVISKEALIWGLLSAVALAVYTTQPGRLLNTWGSMPTTAWGMLIGGIMLSAVFRPWNMEVSVDPVVIGGMAVIILLGTIVAFTCYMEGVRLVGPQKGSLFAAVEPVSATIFSVLLMGEAFAPVDLLGFLLIISTIFLLATSKNQ